MSNGWPFLNLRQLMKARGRITSERSSHENPKIVGGVGIQEGKAFSRRSEPKVSGPGALSEWQTLELLYFVEIFPQQFGLRWAHWLSLKTTVLTNFLLHDGEISSCSVSNKKTLLLLLLL